MKVSELITELQKMPGDAEVAVYWDSAARSLVHDVWLAKSGQVVLGDEDDRQTAARSGDEDAPA